MCMKFVLATKIYALLSLILMLWLGWQFVSHAPIQTQLTALLPQDSQNNPIVQLAETRQEKLFNQQIVVLVGNQDSERVFKIAKDLAQTWRNDSLFEHVDSQLEPNLSALRQSVQSLGLATLPMTQAQQLLQQPERYFEQRAQDAVNPFAINILPLEQDWLGLGRFAWRNGEMTFMWHPEQAMLYTEYEGKTWVLIRVFLRHDEPNPAVWRWWQTNQQTAQIQGYDLLSSSGALFAAEAKIQAEYESSIMSVLGILLTFGLLLWVFRSWRIFILILPLALGILWGLATTIMIFGYVHALTLVIGTSLIGVLVDFPLHWLASSLFVHPPQRWQAREVMNRVLPSFSISLVITAVGYVLLWFTPLPILQQTAVFSTGALLGAFGATVCFLPYLFPSHQARHTPFTAIMQSLSQQIAPKKLFPYAFVVFIFLLLGISQLHWKDDIKNWVSLNAVLLAQTQRIAQISGIGTGQTLLITANSPDELLKQSQQVAKLMHDKNLAKTQSLDEWVLPTQTQNALKQQFKILMTQPQVYAPLEQLGIERKTLVQALEQAANMPIVSLDHSLNTPQAEAFRSLYLGQIDGKYAGLVRLFDVKNAEALEQAMALHTQWQLLDKRHHLNQQFSHTRDLAAYLKVVSFLLAWLVLWRIFGIKRGSIILAMPLCAVGATLGVLGYLGIEVSLFALFGLLLATAIGIDYAVYATTAPETQVTRITGITLAGLTTLISFVLLTLSSTPAVFAFGVSVSFGVLFNWAMAVVLSCCISSVSPPLKRIIL